MPCDDYGRSRKFIFQIGLLIPFGLLRELKREATAVGLKLEHLCIFAVELSADIGKAGIIVYLADIHHEEIIHEVLP